MLPWDPFPCSFYPALIEYKSKHPDEKEVIRKEVIFIVGVVYARARE